jgi:multicomponent Na+:H+ antiporter subunit A
MMTWTEGAVAAPFAAAALVPFLGSPKRLHGWLFAAFAMLLFAGALFLIPAGAESSREWASSLGLTLSFKIDHLSRTFLLLIFGIGSLVLLYAGSYMEEDPHASRFFSSLFAFMGSMAGLATADSILLIFVFWELTSITSFLLISHKAKLASRKAALMALYVTAAGGLCLLAGLLLAGHQQSVWTLSLLQPLDPSNPTSLAILLLVALGCFAKSAQFPLHGWLPGAMEAPSPVSAYLHSATMVKAGVLLLAKSAPLFGQMPGLWTGIIGGVGALTLALGGIFVFFATDLKRILAFSTVSSLGGLTMVIGFFPTAGAAKAFAAFLVAHALYKGALFLLAGTVEHSCGTRDITKAGGLASLSPGAAWASALAALSMAGLFPLLGFVGKEYLLGAALAAPWALAATLVGAASSVYAAFQAGIRPWFMGKAPEGSHAPGLELILAPWPLVIAGAALPWAVGPILDPLAQSFTATEGLQLKLWAGVNTEFLLSLATLAVGGALAWSWPRWQSLAEKSQITWGPTTWVQKSLEGLAYGAKAAARRLEHGRVRWDFMTYFISACGLAGAALWLAPSAPAGISLTPPAIHEVIIVVCGVAAAIASLAMKSRLAALALLGGLGLALASIFLFMGAPDLAITQLLVDILVVVFLVVVFARLPRFHSISSSLTRWRDAFIAVGVGSIFATLTFLAVSSSGPPSISTWMAERSVAEAKGSNVVNTILVDFRALDTLGEATVLAVAALGIFAIVRLKKQGEGGANA